jgi:hypothetical protein
MPSTTTSTVRFFVNNERVSTAVLMPNGTVLQVFPEKRSFASEAAWRTNWTPIVEVKRSAPKAAVAAPKVTIAPPPPKAAVAHPKVTVAPPPPKAAVAPPKAAATAPKAAATPPKPALNPSDWAMQHKTFHTVPAGTYYIGDLCYALGDDVYERIFGGIGGYDDGLYVNNKNPNEFFMTAGTSFGDGLYAGSDGNDYAVDAGIIGITPMFSEKDCMGGHIHTFNTPVRCSMKNGRFRFFSDDGSVGISIRT